MENGGLDGQMMFLGALTQGTLEDARENLIDAVRMIREPVDSSKLPKNKIVIEQIEV